MATSLNGTRLITEEIEKPDVDQTIYRLVELSNGVQVLLGHDPKMTKAGAAMSIRAGSFNDPDHLSGLAHAVEHFLFMGTKKYPVENDFQEYLSSNGGSYIGQTSSMATIFGFDITVTSSMDARRETRSPFYNALDKFAQFFITPLFRAESIERELRTIESEFQGRASDDVTRMYMLDQQLASEKHPYHRFMAGNLQSLKYEPKKRKLDVRQMAIDFWKTYYSANKMSLVMLGREDLLVLQGWAEELFVQIPNHNLPEHNWPDNPLPAELPLLTVAESLSGGNSLHIIFPYHDEEYSAVRDWLPGRYLEHLIGYEGNGSALAAIRSNGYGHGLNASISAISPGYGTLRISVELTQEGLQAFQDVARIIFQYLHIIKTTIPEQSLCEEIKQLKDISFRFQERYGVAEAARDIVENMQMSALPRRWILRGSLSMGNFSEQDYIQATSLLKADNYRLLLVTKDPSNHLVAKERWYDTKYSSSLVGPAFQRLLKDALEGLQEPHTEPVMALPSLNEFVPKRLTPLQLPSSVSPNETPVLIRNDDKIRLWWMTAERFGLPKASFNAYFKCPGISTHPQTLVAAKVWSRLVMVSMERYLYDMNLAGLNCVVQADLYGIKMMVNGFSDTLPVLLRRLVDILASVSFTDKQLQQAKESVLQELEEQVTDMSSLQAIYKLGWLMTVNEPKIEDLQVIVSESVKEDIDSFQSQFLDAGYIEAFAHGDMSKDSALRMGDIVLNKLCPTTAITFEAVQRQTNVLPLGSNLLWKISIPSHLQNCVSFEVFTGSSSESRIRAQTLLFKQICSEMMFDRLRTKEQIAYSTYILAGGDANTTSYSISCSTDEELHYAENRIEAFLFDIHSVLLEMPQELFEAHRRTAVDELRESRNVFELETSYTYSHILMGDCDFLEHKTDMETIQALSKQDMLDFWSTHVDPRSNSRTKISLHLIAEQGGMSKTSGLQSMMKKCRLATRKFVSGSNRGLHGKLGPGSGYQTPLVIADIDQFRSNLQLAEQRQPLKDLKGFEEK